MWNERYQENPHFYGKMPNDFLVSAMVHLPKKGKILCLADGEGRNSVFLARAGFKVTGVDYSDQAIEHATELAKENGVDVSYEVVDLNDYSLGTEEWDGIVSIFCHFPSVERKRLHQKVVQALKPGGVFVVESYTPAQLALGTGGPSDPDMLATVNDLKLELEGLEFIEAEESERMIFEGLAHNGPSSVAQIVAKKA